MIADRQREFGFRMSLLRDFLVQQKTMWVQVSVVKLPHPLNM